jgi:hypothetical protein
VNILALDLGCKTGYASNIGDRFEAGTWKLSTERERKIAHLDRLDRRCDPRVLELYHILTQFRWTFDAVVYEDVQFSSYTAQVQLWSSYRAAVWIAFGYGEHKRTILECVPVTTLKLWATGHGGATKEMMEKSCKRSGFDTSGLDDNAVDAIMIHQWAKEKFKRL